MEHIKRKEEEKTFTFLLGIEKNNLKIKKIGINDIKMKNLTIKQEDCKCYEIF